MPEPVADQIGVVPEPVVPFVLVGATIVAIAIVAIVVGERPARAAAGRRSPYARSPDRLRHLIPTRLAAGMNRRQPTARQ